MQLSQIALVQESWEKINPIRAAAAEMFYAKLFELDPSLRTFFHDNPTEQGDQFMKMVATAVATLNKPDELLPVLQALGTRHARYGVKDNHYDTMALALFDTLHKGLGTAFTNDIQLAWKVVFSVIATTMKNAANKTMMP
jgi:hemoglobin-like flavoprotein